MIYLITGENAYRVEQELRTIARDLPLRRIAGDDITPDRLADVMMGMSLFTEPEVAVLTHLADNSQVWEKLGEWIGRVDNEKTIVIVEPHPDKRTKAYKAIERAAIHIKADLWTDRERALAREWLVQLAKKQQTNLSPSQVEAMLQRAMVPGSRPGSTLIDQTRLATALRSLALLDEVSDGAIEAVMPAPANESIFRLLEMAIEKNTKATRALLTDLRSHEDPHYVFALLASQWFQLVAVALASPSEASEYAGVNPYIARKFAQLAQRISRRDIRTFTGLCADIDAGMKLSEFAPWDGVERFVIGIALRS